MFLFWNNKIQFKKVGYLRLNFDNVGVKKSMPYSKMSIRGPVWLVLRKQIRGYKYRGCPLTHQGLKHFFISDFREFCICYLQQEIEHFVFCQKMLKCFFQLINDYKAKIFFFYSMLFSYFWFNFIVLYIILKLRPPQTQTFLKC